MYRLLVTLGSEHRCSQVGIGETALWLVLVLYVLSPLCSSVGPGDARIQCRPGKAGGIACSADRTFTLTTDFSNTLSKSQIEEMATVDEFEVVKEVQASPILQLAVERCIAQVSWIPNLGGY